VIDGDTVRFNGAAYRLMGLTRQSAATARCDDERRRAEAATKRLPLLPAAMLV